MSARSRRAPCPIKRTKFEPEIFEAIDLLARTEGILTEPAGGTTIAVLGKLAARGRFAADETVVAMITGNGLKTLDDHPQRSWPDRVECSLEAMSAALEDLKSEESLLASAQHQLRP